MERKAATTEKEASSTINQSINGVIQSPKEMFQKVQVEDGTITKPVDPQKSVHGLKFDGIIKDLILKSIQGYI
uniref:Uncharacterized protein n=1 Tax=Panagrolaimus sp. ES5 TaxID=591445 RepID=A0AC34GE69_9BILA